MIMIILKQKMDKQNYNEIFNCIKNKIHDIKDCIFNSYYKDDIAHLKITQNHRAYVEDCLLKMKYGVWSPNDTIEKYLSE